MLFLIDPYRYASAGGGGDDPTYANVYFHSHLDGTDGATTATDVSSLGSTMTFAGNAQIDTAQSKFGGASLLLDGTGDGVLIGTYAASGTPFEKFRMTDRDSTIRGWIKANALTGTHVIFSYWGAVGRRYWILSALSTGAIRWNYMDGDLSTTRTVETGTGLIGTSDWHYVAVNHDLSATEIRIFVDGNLEATHDYSVNDWANPTNPGGLVLGAFHDGSDYDNLPFNGWLDEWQLIADESLYDGASTIDVPSAAFPES